MAAAPSLERRIVTVLFADLVGFTTLAEQLDPEDVAAVQDAYFSTVRETIARYRGVLEKFIGDAAMAVFGLPQARDDDAERAVRAGLALVSAVGQLDARLSLDGQTLRLRVGVNSGEVAYATGGADAGRVTGDTVNLAARLQTAARPGTVLVGPLTQLLVEETIELAASEPLELKGKAKAVRAREARGARPQPSRDAVLGSLRAPLTGRDAELRALVRRAARLRRARSAGRHLIVAPPGVGKSRLLAELAVRLADIPVQVLRARVRPHALAPYEAVGQLLLAALGDTGDPHRSVADALLAGGTEPGRAAVVAREVLAAIGRAPAASEDPARPLTDERTARFTAWTEALDALSGGAATAWLVEDVHWAGGDLLAFLDHAGRAPTAGGRLVLATARPSIREVAPEWSTAGDMLDLPELAPTDARALVQGLVADALPEELLALVAERSDGNPLFIEELLRSWISVGILQRDNDRWRLAVSPDQVTLPLSVQAIYAAQLDDLPRDARTVARRASVAGRRFSSAALEPLDLVVHRDGLIALRTRGFVVGPQASPEGEDVYAYRHALLRDAGYASLARAERARLHEALARWLESVAGDRVERLAETIGDHFAAALDSLPALAPTDGPARDALRDEAARWLERGAEAALRVAAHEAGLRLMSRSVGLTPADARLDLARRRLRRGEVMAQTGDLAAGAAEIGAALELYRSALSTDREEAPTGLLRAAHSMAAAQMQQLEFHRAEELTRGTLTQLADVTAAGRQLAAGRARLMALHAWSLAALGRADGVRAEIAAAVALARRAGDPAAELDVLERRAACRGEIGDLGDGVDPAREWGEIEAAARQLGRWPQVVTAGRTRAIELGGSSIGEALSLLEEVRQLAHDHGFTEQEGWCGLAIAEGHFVAGDWEDAMAVAAQIARLAERNEYVRLAFRIFMVLLPMAARRRDARVAEQYAAWWTQNRSHLPPSPSPYGMQLVAASRCWADLAAGIQPEMPPSELVPATGHVFANPHLLDARETLAEAWLAARRLDLAGIVRDHTLAAASEPDATPLIRSSAALLSAWVALAEGDRRAARRHAGRAVSEARSLGAGWWLARAARALEAAGGAPAALVDEAAAIERRLGAPAEPARR